MKIIGGYLDFLYIWTVATPVFSLTIIMIIYLDNKLSFMTSEICFIAFADSINIELITYIVVFNEI